MRREERKLLKEKERLYTVEEAAEYLRYHPEHIRRLARRGELRGLKIGRGGGWRFSREALDAILVRVYPEEVDET